MIGAILGSLFASHAPLFVLAGVFGTVALLIAAKMLLPLDDLRFARNVPRRAGGGALATLIGIVSAMMGIGAVNTSVCS